MSECIAPRTPVHRRCAVAHVGVSGPVFADGGGGDLDFEGVRLSGARFDHCDLRGAEIIASDVRGMRINDVLVTDLLDAYFRVRVSPVGSPMYASGTAGRGGDRGDACLGRDDVSKVVDRLGEQSGARPRQAGFESCGGERVLVTQNRS